MAAVELRSVHKTYRMGESMVRAVRGVDLSIRQGEFVAIWGPSGSGKSTLCNLMGLLDEPTAGRVFLNDQDVSGLSDDQLSQIRSRSVGFVFQSFNLVPVLSAVENVSLPLEMRGQNSKSAWDKAMKTLQEVGMSGFAHHRPQKLSGGQQQRVAIARALVADPTLVIADEPTGNLDSETARIIIDLMWDLNRRSGTTFIFSTHDQRLLDRVNRRILLRDGAVMEDVGS